MTSRIHRTGYGSQRVQGKTSFQFGGEWGHVAGCSPGKTRLDWRAAADQRTSRQELEAVLLGGVSPLGQLGGEQKRSESGAT